MKMPFAAVHESAVVQVALTGHRLDPRSHMGKLMEYRRWAALTRP
jgi:hypothetical protein